MTTSTSTISIAIPPVITSDSSTTSTTSTSTSSAAVPSFTLNVLDPGLSDFGPLDRTTFPGYGETYQYDQNTPLPASTVYTIIDGNLFDLINNNPINIAPNFYGGPPILTGATDPANPNGDLINCVIDPVTNFVSCQSATTDGMFFGRACDEAPTEQIYFVDAASIDPNGNDACVHVNLQAVFVT